MLTLLPCLPMLCRRLAAALLALVAAGSGAAPPETARFDRFALERAVAARAPVVLHFTAGWCRACQLQQPLIRQLLQEPALRPVSYFSADYDRERLLKSILGVAQPGTLVVFRDGTEVARSTGETSRSELRRTFLKAARDLDPVEAARTAGTSRSSDTAPAPAPAPSSPGAQTPFTPYSLQPSGRRP